ncbi:MAG TPA: SRPBCC family protein [Rhizomicrobium sp.]|nr:SRPBCC family protein [Rhizomicrobium sp.]
MSRFLYVTYIRTTEAKLWDALTKPEFMRQYWFGFTADCSWKKGAPWALVSPDGKTMDAGEILEVDPPKKLVIKWQHQSNPDMREEGYSRATFEISSEGDTVKLTVAHEIDRTPSILIEKVSGGWPAILASLKSLLETGHALERGNTLRN